MIREHDLEIENLGTPDIIRGFDSKEAYDIHAFGAETESTTAKFLQDLTNRALKKLGFRDRVVVNILKKGLRPTAFASNRPRSYNISISQALINCTYSLDELVFVLCHEILHIVKGHLDKSYDYYDKGEEERLAVEWFEELEADDVAKLMEYLGYNPIVGADFFEHLGNTPRGEQYLASRLRAARQVWNLYMENITTSNQAPIPIPQGFITGEPGFAEPSEEELVDEAIDNGDAAALRAMIMGLHPQNLYRLISSTSHIYSYRNEWVGTEEASEVRNEAVILLESVLAGAGLSLEEKLMVWLDLHVEDKAREILIAGDIDLAEFVNLLAVPAIHLNQAKKKVLPNIGQGIPTILIDTYLSIIQDITSDWDLVKIATHLEEIVPYISSTWEFYDSDSISAPRSEEIAAAHLVFLITRLAMQKGFESIKDDYIGLLQNLKSKGLKLFLKENGKQELNYKLRDKLGDEGLKASEQILQELENMFTEKPPRIKDLIDKAMQDAVTERDGKRLIKGSEFFRSCSGILRRKDLTIEDFEYFLDHISVLDAELSSSFKGYLNAEEVNTGRWFLDGYDATPEDKEFARLQAKIFFLTYVSEVDAVYANNKLEELMKESEYLLQDLPPIAKHNFVVFPLSLSQMPRNSFRELVYFFSNVDDPEPEHWKGFDIERYLSIPLVKESIIYPDFSSANSIPELIKAFENFRLISLSSELHRTYRSSDSVNIFGENGLVMLMTESLRKRFVGLMPDNLQDLEDEQLIPVLTFFKRYFPRGSVQARALAYISTRIVQSDQLNLKQKMGFILSNLDIVGPTAIEAVIDQIPSPKRYLVFIERIEKRYKDLKDEHSSSLGKILKMDYENLQLWSNHESFIRAIDINEGKALSLDIAARWVVNKYIHRESQLDSKTGKMIKDIASSQISLADSFEALRALPFTARFLLIQKALLEDGGMLEGEEGRLALAARLKGGIGLEAGFIAQALESLVLNGDSKFISFPIANLGAPLLFQGLKIENITKEELLEMEYEEHWRGPKAKIKDNLPQNVDLDAVIAKKSSDLYQYIDTTRPSFFDSQVQRLGENYAAIAKIVDSDSIPDQTVMDAEVGETNLADHRQEAIIKGVEGTGPLGIRSLQLGADFVDLPTHLHNRISEARDANKGLGAYLFRKNLIKYARENRKLLNFINSNRLKIKKFVGGGSLVTVYEGTIEQDGVVKEIVIKLTNPNPQAIIANTSRIAKETMQDLIQNSTDPEVQTYAQISMDMIDMSEEWSLTDIASKDFEQDDVLFRQVMRAAQTDSNVKVFIPGVLFHSPEVTIEEKAPGITANQFMKSLDVTREDKRTVLKAISDIYNHQLNAVIDLNGLSTSILHSDTHLGNFMVNRNSDGTFTVSIIDRSMFLKIESGNLTAFKSLFNQDRVKFLNQFVDLILAQNDSKNVLRALSLKAEILKSVAGVVGEKDSSLKLFQTLLRKFKEQNLRIPLWVRLLIKNIIGIQNELDRLSESSL